MLFDRRVFAALRAADPHQGAKPVINAHAAELLNVPVTDEGAFVDLDVPEDYERVAEDGWRSSRAPRPGSAELESGTCRIAGSSPPDPCSPIPDP